LNDEVDAHTVHLNVSITGTGRTKKQFLTAGENTADDRNVYIDILDACS
jgi:hypothetical protein